MERFIKTKTPQTIYVCRFSKLIIELSSSVNDILRGMLNWQLMALLLLRHALSITDDTDGDSEEDDASTFLSVSFCRSHGEPS